MKVLLCLSNMFVPTVLTQILSDKKEKYIVVIFESGLKELLEHLLIDNLELFYFKYPRIFETWRCKRYILDYFKHKNITELYFYHDCFGGICNWLIVVLSKKSKVYYSRYVNTLHSSKVHNLKSYVLRVLNMMLYGIDVDIYHNEGYYKYALKPSFLKKVKAHNIVIKPHYELLREHLPFLYSLKNKNIILLAGSIVASGAVSEDEYSQKIDDLIMAISEEATVVKCHPRFNDLYGKEKELEAIPSYIPANLILDRNKIYIGYTTVTLVEAAKIGAKSISLLYYLMPTSNDVVRKGYNYLVTSLKGDEKIYFPTNLVDIINIIGK